VAKLHLRPLGITFFHIYTHVGLYVTTGVDLSKILEATKFGGKGWE